MWGELSVELKLILVHGFMTLVGGALVLAWWYLSGHLQRETVWVWITALFVSAGCIVLAARGHEVAALWSIIGILMLAVSTDIYCHGPANFSIMTYVVPITMAGIGVSGRASLMLASLGSAWLLAIGWAQDRTWYAPPFSADNTCFAFVGPSAVIVLFYLSLMLALVR